jgi:polyisoprenoid-binding protein YceI
MTIKSAWRVDPSQSTIAFKAGYMILGVIAGEFRDFEGSVLFADSFEEMELEIIVHTRSMTSFHQQRDQGILSASGFDADTWPVIRFVSNDCRRISSGGLFEMRGLLSIRGITGPQEIMVSLASFDAGTAEVVVKFSGNLNRSDFGLGDASTPEQDNVADAVNFFGEVLLRPFAGG